MRARPAPTAVVVLLAVASMVAVAPFLLRPQDRAPGDPVELLEATFAMEAALEQEAAAARAAQGAAPSASSPASPVHRPAAPEPSFEAANPSDTADPVAPVPPLPAEEPSRGAVFYFFSPDWRPADFGKLAVAVEAAFGSGGLEVSFQAFTKYDDFERQALERPPQFLIAPAWIEDACPAALGGGYEVVARPVRRGRTTYRKALMTRTGIDSIDDLARGSIAATVHSMGPGEPAPVLSAFRLSGDSARIVPVPKDVDALLALSFGQVDAALVTSEQYEQLAQTNPADTARMRVLAFTPEIGLPPVYAAASTDAALRDRLRDVLRRLPDVSEGPTVLALLGVDGFEPQAGPRAEPDVAPPAAAEPAAEAGPGVAKRPPPAGVAKSPPSAGVAKTPPPAEKKKPGAPRR